MSADSQRRVAHWHLPKNKRVRQHRARITRDDVDELESSWAACIGCCARTGTVFPDSGRFLVITAHDTITGEVKNVGTCNSNNRDMCSTNQSLKSRSHRDT